MGLKVNSKSKFVHHHYPLLYYSSMTFPTWGALRDLIVEAEDNKFPSQHFGNNPIRWDDDTLVPIKPKFNTNGKKYSGVDISVLLKPEDGGNGKTIVIVGESPLRDTKNPNNQNIVLLGTPYAVHQKKDCPKQCNVYKMIFNDLLKAGYSIYLTDIFKIWWQNRRGNKDLDFNEIEKKVLEEEFKIFGLGDNPIIVIWSKLAADILRKKKMEKKDFLLLPHPCKKNWNNWKLFIFEKAVYKDDVNYAKDLYPCPDEDYHPDLYDQYVKVDQSLKTGSTTTEDIVASEAVKEILDYCQKKSNRLTP